MKFSEFKYERPDFNLYKEKMISLIDQFKAVKNAEEQLKVVSLINETQSYRNNGDISLNSS